ncbi:MAG: TolC family protein [Chitinophagales bacterium]|nr:TolC family protein [Chitinophagales bacterium]
MIKPPLPISLLSLLLLVSLNIFGQSLTIDSCYSRARSNYPLIKQHSLIATSQEYSLKNAAKGYLPQLSVAGQATYQSEVTKVSVPIPGVEIQSPSKDQYKLYGEVVQPLTDLVTVKLQKELTNANAEVEQQKLEVELYKLQDRINQLYFGVLIIDAQVEQNQLLRGDIQRGIDKAKAGIAYGTALKSSADLLKAELLKTEQRQIELQATRKAYLEMLGLFINQPLDTNTTLQTPLLPDLNTAITRPELSLYASQAKIYDTQRKLANNRTLPRFNIFLQGGMGRPALNLLNNDFEPYYIGGLRLNWNLSAFYTVNNERKNYGISQQIIDAQKETFLFNLKLTLAQQDNEIAKLKALIQTDDDIVKLRENVKNASLAQLENGIITSNDYLSNLNAEDLAKQNLRLHQIQLLMAVYNYKTTSGN